MIKNIKRHIPKKLIRAHKYFIRYNIPKQDRTYRNVIKRIRDAGQCRILFIASSLPMWRYDGLISLLSTDKRFEVLIAILPFDAFTSTDKARDIKQLSNHFTTKGVPYTVVDDFAALKNEFKPDVIVYPQPYDTSYSEKQANWKSNTDCLLIHTPYSIPLSKFEWYFNQALHNVAWRLYLPTEIHREVACKLTDVRGKNVVVVGELKSEEFALPAGEDPWKKIEDGKKRKRLIWAPHFTVVSYNMFDRPDFNWSYEIMREVAQTYADRLQIAFKPHPRLRTELYKHPDWGKERTDEFYAFWENSPNTQLEMGNYPDLFKTSDAMIHNCGSFTAEYLFVNKPVGYATGNLAGIKADMNDFGLACQDAHYTLASAEDIRRFIDEVVLGGDDRMSEERTNAIGLLKTASGERSVSENLYKDLVDSLFG